jgi:hypothetical protein
LHGEELAVEPEIVELRNDVQIDLFDFVQARERNSDQNDFVAENQCAASKRRRLESNVSMSEAATLLSTFEI